MKRRPLALFFALAFVFSWAAWLPLVAAHAGLLADAPSELHLLGSLGPAVAALLVSSIAHPPDVRALLSGMMRWRASPFAWAFAVLGPTLLLAAGLGVTAVNDARPSLGAALHNAEYPALGPLALAAAQIVFYGFGEEVGWRGFAYPKLKARFGPLWGAALLSIPWAAWHLPLLLRNETYAFMNPALLAGWYVSLLTGSVLTAWLYERSGGSLLVLAVFHGLLDIAMVNEATSPLGLTVTGALVTLWGMLATVALARKRSAQRATSTS